MKILRSLLNAGFTCLLLVAGSAATSATSATATLSADTFSRIRETQSITIAHREASVPFSYLSANKQAIGYSVDICQKLAEAIKRELKLPQLKVNYLLVTPSSRVAAVKEGKADLECGSTTNNAARREQVAFTIPYFFASTRMVVLADSGINNWQDLKKKTVVTTKGTTSVRLLADRSKSSGLELKLIEGNDHHLSFAMVNNATADAFPMDDVLLFGLRATSGDPSRFTIVGDALSTEPYAIFMRKGDPNFKRFIDLEIARMMNDGEITRLYDKWFRSAIPPDGINLNMAMGLLLRDNIRFPSDKVAD